MKVKFIYLLAAIFVLSASFQGCDKNPKDDNKENPTGGGNGNGTETPIEEDDGVSRPTLVVSVNGDISVENFVTGTVGTVTFSRFPATIKEFKQVREQIGETMMGCVALQVMAGELYRRNVSSGTECMKLNNISNQNARYLNLLKEALRARPYQFAAYLEGASWDNGYNPAKPYTIEFHVTPTSAKSYSNDYQTDIYNFFIKSNGHETNGGLQPVQVMKTKKPGEPGENGKYYIIFASSSIYLQCKTKSFEYDFNGLD